ncbi:bifunctional 4-hydroxy-2-oxoglutarate aldolase/2-dehydro-3-deoxy-phosphogluconate aldolase [Lentilactobacillus hilgardii]|nr:bifunctional 4-hydroxy-2-oxoglutarate aldolase/2-dehydro-3-deoxy-phosphogluconate aldolase [Lentilactobacillus hilgardii]MCV3739835.1 bifunctional 4-hydroxy-2-oxoglutarate aldolase/2-dehydro-3-deoxy-phosphogluconate aldolase [Lentilactobacillus hilgardii]
MKVENYPKLTVIMRGYTYDQALLIIKILSDYDHQLAVEVTTNNPDHLKVIHDGNEKYGDKVFIGVGTVLTVKHAQDAIKAGAKFMLGPQQFTEDIYKIAKENHVLTIPGAMTPTEVYSQFQKGADIVKIFPAITTGSAIFNQIQGPFGSRKLMAVGGIDLKNALGFFKDGAGYLGIGSSFFEKQDVLNLNESGLRQSIENFLNITKSIEV